MSDAALEAKYRALAAPVIGERRADSLLASAWTLDTARDVRALTRLMAKPDGPPA